MAVFVPPHHASYAHPIPETILESLQGPVEKIIIEETDVIK